MTTHTPAPWHIAQNLSARVIVASDGHQVSEARLSVHRALGEAVANACVIAAAPELLTALRTCRCPSPANGAPDDTTVEACIARGECGCDCGAAIAKAEGRS